MVSLLTGMYPHNLKNNEQLKNQIFLPEILQKYGYTSYLIGKWGLGKCILPKSKGFESFHGFLHEGADKFSHKIGSKYDFYLDDQEDKSVDGEFSADILAKRVQTVVTDYLSKKLLHANNDVQGCIEFNIDFVGNNIINGSIPDVDNFKECQNLCFQRPDCNFWSWSPPSFATDQRLRCELKSSDSGRASPSGKISGPKSCSGLSSIENGKDKIFLLVSFTLPGAPLQLPSNYKDQYAQVNDKIRRRHLSKHNLNYFCM